MGEITDDLSAGIGEIKTGELSDFLAEHWEAYDSREGETFRSYMEGLAEARGITWRQIFMDADLNEKAGHKIVKGESHTTMRDIIISICLGLHCTVEEVNHALMLYGRNALYSRDLRDAVLIYAFQHHMYNAGDVNELLDSEGQSRLEVRKRGQEEE